jgi:hypothetical protein
MFAMKRMAKRKNESETIRSGTERGLNTVKTTKPKSTNPKNPKKNTSSGRG